MKTTRAGCNRFLAHRQRGIDAPQNEIARRWITRSYEALAGRRSDGREQSWARVDGLQVVESAFEITTRVRSLGNARLAERENPGERRAQFHASRRQVLSSVVVGDVAAGVPSPCATSSTATTKRGIGEQWIKEGKGAIE
jgi:hypothetical protein